MENTITIPVEEYAEFVRAQVRLEHLRLVASDQRLSSWDRNTMIEFILGIKEEENAE